MLRKLFSSAKSKKKLNEPKIIRWRDGGRVSYSPNPFFQKPANIDLTIPNRSGNRVTRAMRPIAFAFATAGAISYGINEITKDENGNGFFQNTIEKVVKTTDSVLRLDR